MFCGFRRLAVPMCAALASLCLIGTAKANSVDPNGLPNTPSNDPPLIVGGGWQEFSWNGSAPQANVEGAFTFTSTSTVDLKVTDWRTDGDQFRIYDNGVAIGLTSSPHNDGIDYGDNLDADYANPALSHGMFVLAPGSHSIVIDTVAEAYQICYGEGYLEATAVAGPTVPLPTTAMSGMVLLGMLGAYRKFRPTFA